MSIMSDQNHAASLTKDALSHAEEFRLQTMRGVLMPLKKHGVQWTQRLLALMALTTIGGCAQIEFYCLQGEVEDLREQLEYEKQRLNQVTKQSDSSANQSVKQQKSAKACKHHTKKDTGTRSSNCVSGRKVVK